MAIAYKIAAEIRHDTGKGASRRLRRTGKVPAVVYGGERKPANIQLSHDFLIRVIDDEAFYTQILELVVDDGRKQKVVLRDLQRHPYKLQVMHVDFQRILDDQLLHLHVPLHFIGEENSPAGKTSGVVVSHQMTDVEVSCYPRDLPEFIEVDLSELKPGDVVKLSDLKVPEGVTLVALTQGEDHDQPVVTASHVAGGADSAEDEADEEEGES